MGGAELVNPDELRRLFPNASVDLLARNARQTPVVESNSRDATLGASEVQGRSSQSILVRVTSHRKKLLDEDNLCEKYHVDLCRYAGIISGDEAEKTKIEVRQFKIKKGGTEKTTIEIFQITQP